MQQGVTLCAIGHVLLSFVTELHQGTNGILYNLL